MHTMGSYLSMYSKIILKTLIYIPMCMYNVTCVGVEVHHYTFASSWNLNWERDPKGGLLGKGRGLGGRT